MLAMHAQIVLTAYRFVDAVNVDLQQLIQLVDLALDLVAWRRYFQHKQRRQHV